MFNSEQIQFRENILKRYHQFILQLRLLETEIEQLIELDDNKWKTLDIQRNQLQKNEEIIIQEYWQEWMKPFELSRCPFCEKSFYHSFDPIDLNGFWWMDRTRRQYNEPMPCEHFQVMTGSINLNQQQVANSLFDCYPGPDAPYVIERLLKLKGVKLVISQIEMSCGYLAYPCVYFAESKISEGLLTSSWVNANKDDEVKEINIQQEKLLFDFDKYIDTKQVVVMNDLKKTKAVYKKQVLRNQQIYYLE